MDLEQKWIRDVQKCDSRPAAERLVERYYDEIYCFAYRQLGNKEDAMDLTQNIFLAVFRALPGYNRKKAAFRTWLYRIAVNKVIDLRRRVQPVQLPLDDLDFPDPEDYAARIQDRALLEQIEQYVSGLDPGLQSVFRLRLYGDYTFPEIAAVLGQSESAVKSQYHRLLRHLRKEFDPND
ncbi:MAG: RNA polymerase sigma factor [Oscillospiraceae bacterium]|nr:RNA polymerase sigma factor [Oscillospiraceae bacterium]